MVLKITLASNVEGWGIMMNGQLESALASDQRVEVSGFVPGNTQEQRDQAQRLNITLYDAKHYIGFDTNELLAYPPDDLKIDLLIMHSYGRHVGKQAQVIIDAKKCKWVLVVHTISEELEKYMKAVASSSGFKESEHELQVNLCEKADLVLAVGPQVAKAYKDALRHCGNQDKVITLMPSIPKEFLGVRQRIKNDSREIFRVLISASAKYFEVKGCDIAAKAFMKLGDPSIHLLLVVKEGDDTAAIKEAMVKEGINLKQLTVREFSGTDESWRRLLCEVDLLIKPSKTEGFGMSGLRAIAADLPVLISENCGLGIALKSLPFGDMYVVDSQDPQVWAERIKEIKEKDVKICHLEVEQLKKEYIKEYMWENQFNSVVAEFVKMFPSSDGTVFLSCCFFFIDDKYYVIIIMYPKLYLQYPVFLWHA